MKSYLKPKPITILVVAIIVMLVASNTFMLTENMRKQKTINTLLQELSAKYGVAIYISYCGEWTLLHIRDKNRANPHVDFYLAYNIYTHETLTNETLQGLAKEIWLRIK